MSRIDPLLLERYTSLRNRYNELVKLNQQGKITFNELVSEVNMDEIHVLRSECVSDYSEKLLAEKDYVTAYHQDIMTVLQEGDLDKLEILLGAKSRVSGLQNTEYTVEVLWFLVRCFEQDIAKVGLAKILFERILDTAERDLPAYTDMLDAILDLKRPAEWYETFVGPLRKLAARTEKNDRTIEVLRKGLTSDSKIVRNIVDNYLPETEDDE